MQALRDEFITLSGDGSQTSNSELAFRPLPPDDPRQRQPDITLAGATLGWTPNPPLEKGLKKTIDYFSDILSGVSQ
jgi:UDP-glucuronate decarboxylase